jgi:hypothetical protein
MSDIFKPDNKGIFSIPFYEAKQLEDEYEINFLFDIDNVNIKGTDTKFKNFYGTEPHFPALILNDESYTIRSEAVFTKESIFDDDNSNLVIYNAAILWNLFGDGIHHSDLIYTPYYLVKGQKIQVEHKYSIPKINCIVSNIDIIRNSSLNWLWKLALRKDEI